MWRMMLSILFSISIGLFSPDGREPMQLVLTEQRANEASRGIGLCVFTSVHHAACYQGVPQLRDFPQWIQDQHFAGGADPRCFAGYLRAICAARGQATPDYLSVTTYDPSLIRLATRTGRVPSLHYCFSPTGRYKKFIRHFVNVVHASDTWVSVLDNQFIGTYEWMNWNTFEFVATADRYSWIVLLLKSNTNEGYSWTEDFYGSWLCFAGYPVGYLDPTGYYPWDQNASPPFEPARTCPLATE